MNTTEMLIKFSNTSGVSGLENVAMEYGVELLSPYGKVDTTHLGNVICTVKEPVEGKPHIMLVAHIDEIGMIVTQITDSGFIKVSNVGGLDRSALLSAPVVIHGKKNINGIICSTPPHLQSGDVKKLPTMEDIYIDTGYSKEELSEIVALGDRITMKSTAKEMLGGLVTGKAMDDRAGCVSLVKALEYLQGQEYDCGLTVVFSGMEEVGAQGAQTATYIVKPTHAIAVDVSFAHTPDAKPEKCGKLYGGAMIGIAPILDYTMSQKLEELAKEKEIPYQMEIMNGRTGTDADKVAITGTGVKTALLSIPLRYMHTAIETLAVTDVEAVGKLMCEYIKAL